MATIADVQAELARRQQQPQGITLQDVQAELARRQQQALAPQAASVLPSAIQQPQQEVIQDVGVRPSIDSVGPIPVLAGQQGIRAGREGVAPEVAGEALRALHLLAHLLERRVLVQELAQLGGPPVDGVDPAAYPGGRFG